MIEYVLDCKPFALDYPNLKWTFQRYEALTDQEFLDDLPNILHFAVFVCWFKGLQAFDVLSDTGLIHELVHLMAFKCDGSVDREQDWASGCPDLTELRRLFNNTVRLS